MNYCGRIELIHRIAAQRGIAEYIGDTIKKTEMAECIGLYETLAIKTSPLVYFWIIDCGAGQYRQASSLEAKWAEEQYATETISG